jgi:hypothetical protein
MKDFLLLSQGNSGSHQPSINQYKVRVEGESNQLSVSTAVFITEFHTSYFSLLLKLPALVCLLKPSSDALDWRLELAF